MKDFAGTLGAAALLLSAMHSAGAVETTHIFGFTAGSDVGDDPEAEMETTARLGKRTGSYAGLFNTFEARYTPIKNLRVGPTLTVSRHSISGVSGLADTQQTHLQGASFKVKYRLLERESASFGLTLVAEPSWNRIDDTSGQQIVQYGSTFSMLLDREIGTNWFAALNLIFEAASSRSRGTTDWEREAKTGIAAALTHQFRAGWFAGIEARYFRKYEGFNLSHFAGHGVFVGPTFFANLPNRWWISGAWNVQIAGRAPEVQGALDLTNFVRHYALFRIGVDF
jgi:hypothetical protein